MKVRQVIATTAAVLATGSVFAQQTYPSVDFNGHQGTDRHAEVIQELKDAKAKGDYVVGGREYVDPADRFVSSKTRAQVITELEQSKADGSYDLAHREWVDPGAGFVSTKTRAQVIEELRKSKEDGSFDRFQQQYPG